MRLLYHQAKKQGQSPFDQAALAAATQQDAMVVCPYIGLPYLLRLLSVSASWRLVTDVNAWLESVGRREAQDVVTFVCDNLLLVRHHEGVHAKAVIGAKSAYLGSANLTQLGMLARTELGMQLTEPEHLRELRAWYESLWSESEVIEPAEMDRVLAWQSSGHAADRFVRDRDIPRVGQRTLGRIASPAELPPRSVLVVADIDTEVLHYIEATARRGFTLLEMYRVLGPKTGASTRDLYFALLPYCASLPRSVFSTDTVNRLVYSTGRFEQSDASNLATALAPFDRYLSLLIDSCSAEGFTIPPSAELLAQKSSLRKGAGAILLQDLVQAGLLHTEGNAVRLNRSWVWTRRFQLFTLSYDAWRRKVAPKAAVATGASSAASDHSGDRPVTASPPHKPTIPRLEHAEAVQLADGPPTLRSAQPAHKQPKSDQVPEPSSDDLRYDVDESGSPRQGLDEIAMLAGLQYGGTPQLSTAERHSKTDPQQPKPLPATETAESNYRLVKRNGTIVQVSSQRGSDQHPVANQSATGTKTAFPLTSSVHNEDTVHRVVTTEQRDHVLAAVVRLAVRHRYELPFARPAQLYSYIASSVNLTPAFVEWVLETQMQSSEPLVELRGAPNKPLRVRIHHARFEASGLVKALRALPPDHTMKIDAQSDPLDKMVAQAIRLAWHHGNPLPYATIESLFEALLPGNSLLTKADMNALTSPGSASPVIFRETSNGLLVYTRPRRLSATAYLPLACEAVDEYDGSRRPLFSMRPRNEFLPLLRTVLMQDVQLVDQIYAATYRLARRNGGLIRVKDEHKLLELLVDELAVEGREVLRTSVSVDASVPLPFRLVRTKGAFGLVTERGRTLGPVLRQTRQAMQEGTDDPADVSPRGKW